MFESLGHENFAKEKNIFLYGGAANFEIAKDEHGYLVNASSERLTKFFGRDIEQKESVAKREMQSIQGFTKHKDGGYIYKIVNRTSFDNGEFETEKGLHREELRDIEATEVSIRVCLISKDEITYIQKGEQRTERVKITALFRFYRDWFDGYVSDKKVSKKGMFVPGMNFVNYNTIGFYEKYDKEVIPTEVYQTPIVFTPKSKDYINKATKPMYLPVDKKGLGFKEFLIFLRTIMRLDKKTEDKTHLLDDSFFKQIDGADSKEFDKYIQNLFDSAGKYVKRGVEVNQFKTKDIENLSVMLGIGVQYDEKSLITRTAIGHFALSTNGDSFRDDANYMNKVVLKESKKDEYAESFDSAGFYVNSDNEAYHWGIKIIEEGTVIEYFKNLETGDDKKSTGGVSANKGSNGTSAVAVDASKFGF